MVEQVRQRPVRPDLDYEPCVEEVRTFLQKAKMGVGTADPELPAEFCGAMLENEAALGVLVDQLGQIWCSGSWEGHRRPVCVERHSLRGWGAWSSRKKLAAAREFGLRVAWMQENPKIPGKPSHARYEVYKRASSLAEARELLGDGWDEDDVAWDFSRGYLRVFPQSMQMNTVFVAAADSPEEWPEEWKCMKGVPVYKGEGDPSVPDNYRMIMVGDFAQSVLGGVMLARLETIVAEFGLETQSGGTKGRGGMDAIFALKQVLSKRRQHQQDTWSAFVDLKKAYPSVPRHVLFRVLQKFGVPAHFIQVLKRFYTDLMVRVTLSPDTSFDMPAGETGVREGCRLSPTLFILVMQAVCELVEPLWKGALSFRTCLEHRHQTVRGKAASRMGTLRRGFNVWALLFMDDMWAAADSRANLRVNLNTFVRIGAAFGFEMHAGTPGCGSKTKAFMVMAAGSPRVPDLSPLVLADGRSVPFVESFKYLGSVFHDSLRDEEAITARLNKANALFAMNKKLLCSKATSKRVKGIYYESCVLAALQYGVEAWKLTKKQYGRLQSFHRQKVRQMGRITTWQARRYHVSAADLERRLGLRPVQQYVAGRTLQFTGHTSRMGPERLPHRMMFAWTAGPRLPGGQEVSLGSSLRVHLQWFGLPTKDREWLPIARQKRLWRDLIGVSKSDSKRTAFREGAGQSEAAQRSQPRRAARGF